MTEIIRIAASASDIAPRPAGSIHFEPNAPGATCLRDAKPLWIDGKHVTAELYQDRITIFLGCAIIYAGALPEGITRDEINTWVAQFALAWNLPEGTRVMASVFGRWTEGTICAPNGTHGVMVRLSYLGGHQVTISDPSHLRAL